MYNEFRVPHEVFESAKFRELNSSAKILYVVLCKLRNRYANTEGWFFRRVEDLAEDSGLNERTIWKAKKQLLVKNFIEKQRGYYKKHGWRGADWYLVNGYQEKS